MDPVSKNKTSLKSIIISTLIAIGVFQLTSLSFEYLRNHNMKREALGLLKKQEIFQAIFQSYPEAEGEAKAGIAQLIAAPKSELSSRSEVFWRQFIQVYVEKSTAAASNESIANLLSWNAMLLGRLQSDPVACVDYFLGRRTPAIVIEGQDYTVPLREAQLKAAVILSAKSTPTSAEPFATTEEAGKILARRYVDSKQDGQTVANLQKVADISPEDGCKAARAFSTALAEGPAVETARLYKYFVAAAQAEKR